MQLLQMSIAVDVTSSQVLPARLPPPRRRHSVLKRPARDYWKGNLATVVSNFVQYRRQDILLIHYAALVQYGQSILYARAVQLFSSCLNFSKIFSPCLAMSTCPFCSSARGKALVK